MLDKLANYLDGVGSDDPNYDYVCYIKAKLAEHPAVAQNTDNELDDADITTSNTEGDEGNQNIEGEMLGGAFKDLTLQNKLKEDEEKVEVQGTPPESQEHQPQTKIASAYIKDVAVKHLPRGTQEDIRRFLPVTPNTLLVHYGMVVGELLPKVDVANFKSAKQNVAGQKLKLDEVLEKAKTKYILLLNEAVIDGHHFLAKAQAAGVTSSLNVLDLTPARFQKQASLLDSLYYRL